MAHQAAAIPLLATLVAATSSPLVVAKHPLAAVPQTQHAAVLLSQLADAKHPFVAVPLNPLVAAKHRHAVAPLSLLAVPKSLADVARRKVCSPACSTARKALVANQLADAKSLHLADVQSPPVPLPLLADATWADATAVATLAAAPKSAVACCTSCSAT